MLLRCRLPLARFSLDIDVSIDAKVTAIFGPSGAGKTSLLDVIAGLRDISDGEIEVGGRTLFSSCRGVNVPPQERGIGYVPQEAALFPHLSVKKNILFGSKRKRGLSSSEAINLDHVIALLEIHHLLERRVTRLSGGEIQRVALARAILSEPRLLLLDEPLASLDVGLKEKILPYLRRVRDEFAIPMIYVSHNPTEVLSLADHVIMIREGKVVAQGAPHDVLASRLFLSNLDEIEIENVFDTRLANSDAHAGRSRVLLKSGQELFVPYVDKPADSFLQVRIPGDDVLVATKRPEGISAGNVLAGKIESIETADGQSILKVTAGETFIVRLTAGAVAGLHLTEGQEIFLVIKTRSCVVL